MTDEITPQPENELQKIEAELEKVKAEIEAKADVVVSDVEAVPAKASAAMDAIDTHIDAFKEDVRANVSMLIPTQAHNTLMAFAESLRAKLKSLF
jgi:GTPase involved in cell partitioning and DNA repair